MEIKDADIHYLVHHEGKPYPVAWISEFESKGYVDATFVLKEKELDVNGALVVIEPHSATKVLRVLHPSVQFEDGVVAGSGWFLGVSPERKVVQTRVYTSKYSGRLIDYGAGWTFCYISDKNGLAVIDTTHPPYTPDMEVEVLRGSENDSLPQEFWKAYDRLLSQK